MRTVEAAVLGALGERALVARDFLWLQGLEIEGSQGVANVGFWSDFGTVTVDVIDGFTGDVESRNFTGSGTLIRADDVPLVSDVSVREVAFVLSPIDDVVATAARGWRVKGQPIQLYRGIFDPETRALVAPAFPRFVGFSDTLTITTPSEGGEGAIELRAVSHSRELTRWNTAVRSDADQQERDPGDRFYLYTGRAGEFELFWGKKQGRMGRPHRPRRQGRA